MSFVTNLVKYRDAGGDMTFIDHVEEFRWHLIRSLIVVIIATVIAFWNIDFIFNNILLAPANSGFVSYRLLCEAGTLIHTNALCFDTFAVHFQNTELSGQFMMSFSVSFVVGIILAFPYMVWEFWRFIRPALTHKEVKGATGIVFWIALLFFAGVLFAYYVITPFTINFFATYQLSPQFENIITITNYYDTLSDLVLGMGIVFELPVLVYFLSKIGILTPKVMKQYNKYAFLIILILSAVITPPDWLSIWLVAIPLTGLYQASIYISSKVLARRSAKNNE